MEVFLLVRNWNFAAPKSVNDGPIQVPGGYLIRELSHEGWEFWKAESFRNDCRVTFQASGITNWKS